MHSRAVRLGSLLAGRLKKPAPAATRKWARQVRWHERASQAACKAGVSNEQPEEAQPAPKAPVNPTLLAAMQQQQRTDRYEHCRRSILDGS